MNWHHEVVAEQLERAYNAIQKNEKARIILEIPPRHGKSRLATELFPAWCLGKDPTMPIIITAHTASLAEKFGLKTKIAVVDEKFKRLFPDTAIRKDARAKANWVTTKGGQYIGVGVGGPITGQGAKLAIIDDPIKNREEAESPTYREKVWDWYTSTLYTRLEGYGAIIVIMTRWHMDDLTGRLLEKQREDEEAGVEHYDKWTVIKLPAIAEEDEPPYRKMGEPLWPQKFTLENLSTIRNIDVYDWASLYQQNPILSENQQFQKDMFKYYDEEDLKGLYLSYYTFVDPAISTKPGADNSVVLTVAKEVYGPRWFRIREDAGRLRPNQVIDLIFKHQAEYKSQVFVETIAYQESLKYSIQEEQRKREQYWTIHEIRPKANKDLRIQGLVPLYSAGVIHHLRTDFQYERELLEFPKGKHDDRIDAMSFGLIAVENTKNKNKVRVIKKKIVGYFE